MNFLKTEKSEWANEKVIVDEVKKSMVEAAKASGLSKQEMPSNVYVETLQWLPETGLVTDAFKIKRKVRFLKNCEKVYTLFSGR